MDKIATDTLELIAQGAAKIINESELKAKLAQGRPLRVKLGVDPTAPDIHLGHAVVLRKLRQFQDLGHHAILIIGDFTAMIGDPSGRSATRPPLTHDQVLENAKSYREQAFKIIAPERSKTVFNGEWFEIMHLEEIMKLISMVTLQQMLQRDDFRDRVTNEQPVRLHELLYPVMQGWDSVKIQADVELGGTDQLFNIMVGRDLQKAKGQEQQVGMVMPILEGLDGKMKMSKSLGNYVALNEAPDQMFGKMMSISDELMGRYYPLLMGELLSGQEHPMAAKKRMAQSIVAQYHSLDLAKTALETFEKRSVDIADVEWPTVKLAPGTDIVSAVEAAYAGGFNLKKSRGDIRRLVEQGSIQWKGEKVQDVKAVPPFETGQVLKLDKIRAVRLEIE